MSLDSEFNINPISNEANFSIESNELSVDFDVDSSRQFEATFDLTVPTLSATFTTTSPSVEASFTLGEVQTVPYATDTEPGIIRIATTTEATSGTSTSTAITPKQLQDHVVATDSTPTEGSIKPVSSGGLFTSLSAKQDTLVSGSSIKTINGLSLLGSGNIDVTAGATAWGVIGGTLSNQTDLQDALDAKQNILTAGENVTIDGNTISATDTTYAAGAGISIENNVISNTQTSAEWGNITGTLSSQTDLQTALDTKQNTLVSGTSIKTVNNNSLLGSGNLDIVAGVSDVKVDDVSVVTSGIANLPIASTSVLGLVKIDGTTITIDENGVLKAHGGSSSDFTLSTNMSSNLTFAENQTATISFTYTSEEDLPAVAQYIIDDTIVTTQQLSTSGNFSLDIKSYLTAGSHQLRLKVVDEQETTHSLYFTISVIAISISSDFDSSIAYTSDVSFRYTPVGEVEKTIHFLFDGTETTETVSTSGRQLTKVFSNLTHGAHTLKVWITATVSGSSVTSNELYYEIIYVSGSTTIIASEFQGTTFQQGETVSIPFIVYNPSSLTSDVDVYVNNVLTSELTVDRTKQLWARAMETTGTVSIRFEAGGTSRTFTITVTAVEIDVHAVTENLELFLTGTGRSNNDRNREQWIYNTISCTLSGFNFVTNGWLNNGLKINNGASVTIPFKPFENDFRTNGKTIEIEFSTSDVTNYSAVVASCMSGNRGFQITAQDALLRSEQSSASTKFKEDEKIRLAFVIENRSANRLIYTYLNGIISGLVQYPSDDDFHQVTPVNITLGSNSCELNVFNIRVYNAALTRYEALNNWIADTPVFSDKLAAYTRNNVYDSYGNILYNRVLAQVPIMTITGDLPPTKGDKKLVTVKYENQQELGRDFEMEEVTLDIQGTSSQYYPKKNYKISKMPTAYSFRSTSIAEKLFTLKADYMESSHAHNTGLARFMNSSYSELTPPQEDDSRVRTAIDGFPIAMYYKANASATASYFGVYNFDNDKESSDTWGFTDGDESWEVSNNTSDRCLFKSADFSDPTAVANDFEARYPKDYTTTTRLQQLVAWVVSCDSTQATGAALPEPVVIGGVTYTTDSAAYRIAKFKDECEDHFNVHFLLSYYVFSEFFGMVDSRAKNLFLNYYDSAGVWYTVFYDLDTAIGLNNEGVNNFNFDIEYHDVIGTEHVFNGENSALWNMVERAYPTEIETLYNTFRNNSKLTYDRVMSFLNTDQIAKICEAQYNEDAYFKYITPLIQEGTATYLYTAQGSRINHIKWWIANRFNYLDSKYTASDYKNNYLTLRLYTPQTWQEVEPDADITLTTYVDQYSKILYGSYLVGEKTTKNTPTTIEAPVITFNDTETIIYGADKILSVGDLAPLYAGTIDVSKALKLTNLKIGHGGNYSNTNLRTLSLGNNTMLQTLDVRNCPNLSGALDISGCTAITSIQTTGTSLTSVKLPSAGAITTLELPTTITNLTIKNQNSITTFVCTYTNITTLVLESVNLNSKDIFDSCTALTKVRLTGVDWTLGSSFTALDRIYSLLGQDEQGYNTPHGVLAGTVRMSNIRESAVQPYQTKFPDVTFVITSPLEEDYICTDFGEIITTSDEDPLIYS